MLPARRPVRYRMPHPRDRPDVAQIIGVALLLFLFTIGLIALLLLAVDVWVSLELV